VNIAAMTTHRVEIIGFCQAKAARQQRELLL
jgi:hypothetical protein